MFEFSRQQKTQLYEEGYVLVPQIVPPSLLRPALKAINSSIGQHFDTIQMKVRGNQDLCPELRTDERIKSLFTQTIALPLAESALGKGKVVLSPNIQIALRFPILPDQPFPLDPHVDGFHPSTAEARGSIRPPARHPAD